jgi:thioredoxin-related protein
MVYKILILLFLFLFSSVSIATPPVFTNSLNKSKTLAAELHRNVIVIFGSENCVYCQNLKQTINSGNLDDLLDDKIVCYIDLDDNPTYKQQYKISIIPDSRFIVNDNQKSKIVGYELNKYSTWLKSLK